MKAKLKRKGKLLYATPYFMLLPAFIFLGIFYFYPLYIAVTKSFYNWSGGFGTGINEFIGFKNYVNIFQDERFRIAWLNVLFFVVTGVAINLIFPPLFAILVSRFTEKTSYILRVINVIPMVVPSVVVYLLWKTIYNPQYGLFTQIAQLFNSEAVVDMLGTPKLAKWAFVFMGFPWTGGTVFLIYYAGISNISDDVLEAAVLDGANVWNLIVHVYYPLLVPQFKLLTAMQIINSVQAFVHIQTITNGGPGDSTYVPGLFIYDMAFGGTSRYGTAAAASVLMTIVICVLVFLNNYVFSRREVNE